MQDLEATPPKQDRAIILDVLRGIAILGILLNNIYGFSGYGFLNEKLRRQFSTFHFDEELNFFQIALVEGKFYSLFSLLFGIGFSIILSKSEQKGVHALNFFYRRLLVLVLFGTFHLYFLWEGDILLLYSFIGMLLPLFRKASNKALLTWAFALMFLPIIIDFIKLIIQWTPGDSILPIAQMIDKRNGIPVDDTAVFYLFREGSGWQEWRNWQEPGLFYRYGYLLDTNRIPKVLAMFLIGFYAGRNKIYSNLEQYKLLLKKVMFWGFLIGLPASFAMAYFEGDDRNIYKSAWGMLDTLFYSISVIPLSLAYTSFVCLYWLRRRGMSKLKVLAPAGRMALTNYLMQTVICTLLFYGAGFGLGQKFGLGYLFAIAVTIYFIQVIYSNLWFWYFQYGPLEWIWRQLTYGKLLALSKKKALADNDNFRSKEEAV